MIVYVGGRWVEEHDAALPVSDPGFLSADAVFETARLFDGGYFRLERHIQRLEQSAAILRIPVPARDVIRDIAFDLAHRNALRDGSFRITITRGREGAALVVATLAPVREAAVERARRGWTLVTARTRTPPADVVPAGLKSTGRTYSLLARLEAADADADDALMLTVHGAVAEGPSWNVFWRRGDTLFTPALATGVLDGVTRAEVIALARSLGMRVEEGVYARSALDGVHEVLATMSSLGPVSVRSLDGVPLPEPSFGPRLRAAYWRRVAESVERPRGTEPA